MLNPERPHKIHLTGRSGLLYNRVYSKKKKCFEHRFQIRIPTLKIRTVYIGTENTWLAKYELALERAINLFDQMKSEVL